MNFSKDQGYHVIFGTVVSDRIDCREWLGTKMPKENDMILMRILRYDLWHRKKLDQK